MAIGTKVNDIHGGLVQAIGDKELIKAMGDVKANIMRRVMRPAINFGLTPITKAAKANVEVESGLTKKAIKKKVGKRGAWGKVYIDPKIEGEYNGKKRKPANTAHLLEFGTEHSEAKPFMRPAVESKRTESLARIGSKAKENLAKLAAKVKSRKK
jgi:HK97 gp10 family phage protein